MRATITRTLVKQKTSPVVVRRPAAAPTEPTLDTRVMRKGATVHVVGETARPNAGKALFAHTNAVLTALGMLQPERPSVAKAAVLTLLGPRAVAHHLSAQHMERTGEDEGELRLTRKGFLRFQERQDLIDVDMANSYLDLILDGKTEGTGVSKTDLFTAKF
jgi:hypothetical protein